MRYTSTTPAPSWNVLRPVAIAAACLALPLALLPALWPTEAAAAICPATDAFPLTTGKNDAGNAGDVKVCNDDTTLFVTYEATFPFCLLETRLHVAPIGPYEDKDVNIPQNSRGHPTPDQFAYPGDDLWCVGTAEFPIELAEIDEIDGGVSFGDTVVVAAFALLEESMGTMEEAWAGTELFVERGPRAKYFTYVVQEPFLCGGDTSKCVFVTSASDTFTGDLVSEASDRGLSFTPPDDGLAAGDAICQDLAEADDSVAAPGTYLAWLSTPAGSPSTRFTQEVGVPYKLVNGTQVAADYAALTATATTPLDHPIDRTQADNPVGLVGFVWTGTSDGGTLSSFGHCSAWADVVGFGFGGRADLVDPRWTEAGSLLCSARVGKLYCFQQ